VLKRRDFLRLSFVGFGLSAIPIDMENIADKIKLALQQVQRVYSEVEIETVMSGNWLRVLRRSLG